jgi:Anti-sigma factor NepR
MHRPRLLPQKDPIGEQLRAMYDSVLSEPLPDQFLDLLERLEMERVLVFRVTDRQKNFDASINFPTEQDSESSVAA